MTLLVPKASGQFFTVNNWGSNPSATPGTSLTPGASGAEGTYAALIAGASVTEDIYGFSLRCSDQSSTSAVANNAFFDLGLDPAGGTSYTDTIIANLVIGGVGPITAVNGREFFFPLFIPSGSSIAGRVRRLNGTAGTMRAQIQCYGRLSMPEWHPVGAYTETLGVTEDANVDATAFTPGNAADGTWASLGSLSKPCWWHQLGYQIDNTAVTAEYTYIDLGYGDGTAGNTKTIQRFMHGGNTTEQIGAVFDIAHPFNCYMPLAAGETLWVRGRCLNAPDTGYQAGYVGVGG